MNTGRSTKRALAALAIGGLAAMLPTAAASAQVAPTPPVTPTVSCVIRTKVIDTYWFGYTNSTGSSITVPVGESNKIPRTVFGRTYDDAAQPDQFKPGVVERSVAVQVVSGTSLTWTVSAYTQSGELVTASATATSKSRPCAVGTSAVSANLRVAGATISVAPETEVRDAAGKLTSATVKFSSSGQRVACSLGGVPNPMTQLWGWNDEFGVVPSAQVQPYAPLPASDIVRVDTFTTTPRFGDPGTISFQRTNGSTRTVADPQRLGTQMRSDGVTLTSYGWSHVVPTVDFTGSCRFPMGNVAAPGAFIGGQEGAFKYSITDAITQTTRAPVFCTFGAATCDVLQEIVGPGGTRLGR